MEQVSLSPRNSMNNLSHKLISIAAGEAHTLALSGDGSVYSWGRGPFGRLGTGSEQDQLFPVRVKFPSEDADNKINIVGVATGAYHSLALSDDGSIYGWGYNTCILDDLIIPISYILFSDS
ncbi:guanyl-nucleotide exchange factor [Lithospermum erythrorhizon]|uniref:Guanyl-nucleotide exchange factor n=1 Tax=Lithospermum erythrorhizon TaxID=34254 RepID=A0AAV3P017_LITER